MAQVGFELRPYRSQFRRSQLFNHAANKIKKYTKRFYRHFVLPSPINLFLTLNAFQSFSLTSLADNNQVSKKKP